ncbi:uncharacterized protein BXZ73DRAFT_80630 [Epithele typhae]|uniref:uncharacterized protein n=1 Tax=Epithele typhae TaxID=378194 RepID=UPI002007C894|nr:uncharacterized protein BXZ73DRAFT_80630 [Epithele typhae]KAH9918406.1 hypothetical protein BXZ73DRAFT_80630 [Epithele typhae]
MTMVVPSGGLQMHLKPSGSRLIIGPAFNHVRCLQVELQSVDLAPPPGWFLKMEAPNLEALMLSTASWKYALKEEQDLINYPSFEDVPAARPIKLLDTDSPSPLQALALQPLPLRGAIRAPRPTSGFWLNSQMQEAHFAHQWVHDQLINFPRHIPLATITSFTLDCPFVNAGALACALELMTALETLRVLLSAPPKDCRERDSRTYLPPSICFQHPPDLGFHWLAISLNPSLDPGRASPKGIASNMVEENSGLLCLAVGRYEGYVKQFLEARADTGTPIRALTLQPFASLQVHTVPEEDFEYEAKEWYHESGANVELVEDTERKWRETFEPLVERFEWVPPGKYIFGDFAKRDYWDVEGQEKYWSWGTIVGHISGIRKILLAMETTVIRKRTKVLVTPMTPTTMKTKARGADHRLCPTTSRMYLACL